MGMYKDASSLNAWDLGIVDLRKWDLLNEACKRQYNMKQQYQFDNILNFDVLNSELDQDYKDYMYTFTNNLICNLTDLEKYALITSYYFYQLYYVRAKDNPDMVNMVLKKIFRSCYDVVQMSNSVLYTELPPSIDRLKVIKKTTEEKYGLFGSKKRIVEYEEENPKFQKMKSIVEDEPYVCFWRSCFLQERPYGASGDVYAKIFTQSGKFYHFEYFVDGDVIDEPYVGQCDLGTEDVLLNLSYLIGDLFNCRSLQELFPGDF